jgi:hypothetical protein
MPGYGRVTPPARGERISWVDSATERASAGRALGIPFFATVVAVALAGVLTIAFTPVDDVKFAGLDERLEEAGHNITCLRAARRADYAIVFIGMGSPSQHLKLLLKLDHVRDEIDAKTEPTMRVFSERMHKSTSMACEPFDPPRQYEALCTDATMVFQGSRRQRYVRSRFTYANDHVEYSYNDRAALLGLDGNFYLRRGTTYWLTTTHLCFEDISDADDAYGGGDGDLQFSIDGGGALIADIDQLAAFREDLPVVQASQLDNCSGLFDAGVKLFPSDAASERLSWLSLSDTFLYEYGNPILLMRREVVEMGKPCADARTDVAHVNNLYRLDCAIIDPAWCQEAPSVPFRRLATARMRFDLHRDGESGELHIETTESLARIPFLVSYGDGLWQAFGRLLIMLLTAAVVFVRGTQNASSSRYMLEHVLNIMHCRDRQAKNPVSYRWAIYHEMSDVIVDASITAVALMSRILVYSYSVRPLISDQLTHVVVFEAIGIAASALHFFFRYVVLAWDLTHEAPLTKLAGPMSICDVSAAVLLAFAETPLLSNDEGRFPAVGRLLIGILISISVLTRCFFAVPMCAALADTVTNDRETYTNDMKGYKTVLSIGAVLWGLQGVTICATLSAVFIVPAAYSLVRAIEGDAPLVVPYCLLFGLLCAGLPTITKVALRTFEHECSKEGLRKTD